MIYDVLIVGAGVTGAMLARELSRSQVSVCLLEKENDVAMGASKANSGIIHGGYDPVPGTLKAKLNTQGVELLFEAARELNVPHIRNGSMVCAFSAEEEPLLEELYEQGQQNNIPDLKIISGDEARVLEPNLSKEVSKVLFGEETLETSAASVVRYAFNNKGELSVIDTPVNGSTGALAVRGDRLSAKDSLFGVKAEGTATTDRRYRRSGSHHTIGPKIAFAPAALAMSVPSGANEDYLVEDNYEAAKAIDLLVHDTTYTNVWAFYDNHKKATSDFVVVFDNGSAGEPQESTKFSVVEQYSMVYDEEDGTEKYALTLLTVSGTIKLIAKDNCKVSALASEKDPSIEASMTINQLKKGDIVIYTTNPKGYLTNVTLWYRSETDTSCQALSTGRWAARSVRCGYIYETLEEGYLMYFADDVSQLEGIKAEDCEYVINTGATPTYFAYEKGENGRTRVYETDLAAIKSYKDTGDDATKIFLHTSYGKPLTIVAFE